MQHPRREHAVRALGANVFVSQSRLLCERRSPPNSDQHLCVRVAGRPSTPSFRPARDQSSVPSTPNDELRLGGDGGDRLAPRLAVTRSVPVELGGVSVCRGGQERRSRRRERASPVGCSVFRYSSPRSARSSPSSACAAPPTQSGCQALKTSCRNPGSVSSAVRMRRRARPRARARARVQPPRASRAAQASELTPLPTTIASCQPRASSRNSSSVTRPRLLGAQLLDRARAGRAYRSSGRSSPSSSALIRIESIPLFLPSTMPRSARDELGRVRLDRRRVVELARDGAALAAEEVLADDRLPRLERVARELARRRSETSRARSRRRFVSTP